MNRQAVERFSNALSAGVAYAAATMVLFVYNPGRIANEKNCLQNTTDAAVYSVAAL